MELYCHRQAEARRNKITKFIWGDGVYVNEMGRTIGAQSWLVKAVFVDGTAWEDDGTKHCGGTSWQDKAASSSNSH